MSTPSRGGQAGTYLSPYQISVSYGRGAARILQNTGADWFSPLDPMRPIAPAEVAGRQWDFPAGYNLNTTPRVYEPITFAALRALADGYDILRSIIETRKDQVARMSWQIKPRHDNTKVHRGEKGRFASTQGLIDRITDLFQMPDRLRCWDDWVRLLLEDLFVLDAPAIYMRRNRAGDLLALEPLDGATIKPVIDDWGRIPQPFYQDGDIVYPVAYQQILKGFPAVDYSTRDLIYRPRNVRVNKAYGYSPVEQIVTTVNIALRKQLFNLEYYTSGNIPDSLIGVPETWTPDQIASYQRYWDSYIEGDLGARRKAKFVPGGVAKTFIQTKEPELKSDFDEWLARICCYAFSVSPQPFIRQMNRAESNTQKELSEEEGLKPILRWIKSVVDEIILKEFGSREVEFAWSADEDVDEAQQAQILSTYVKAAIMTANEARERLGLDPDDNPAANELMVQTTTGYLPLETNTIEGKQALQAAFPEPKPEPQPQPQAQPAAGKKALESAEA